MDAVGFAASALCCDLGCAGSAGCCVLVLCLLSVPKMPSASGTALSLLPWSALLLSLLQAGPQILLDLGLLEQTSHSHCLRQLSYARLYRPHSLPCMSSLGPGPCFLVLVCRCLAL